MSVGFEWKSSAEIRENLRKLPLLHRELPFLTAQCGLTSLIRLLSLVELSQDQLVYLPVLNSSKRTDDYAVFVHSRPEWMVDHFASCTRRPSGPIRFRV